ncbi:MAG: type II secretion system protein GspN, partial [Nitrospirota bacterium]
MLYLLYFVILFFLFLYLLFPYDKLKERLIYEVESKSVLRVNINKLTPLLFNGIRLIEVEVFHRDNPKGAPLFKGDIGLRFSLFRLIRKGIAVKGDIRAYNGEAIANITDRKIQGEVTMLSYLLRKIFGTQNQRTLRCLAPLVDRINALESTTQALSDQALQAKTVEFKQRVAGGETL